MYYDSNPLISKQMTDGIFEGTSAVECEAVLDSLQSDVVSLQEDLGDKAVRLLKTVTAVTDNAPAAKASRLVNPPLLTQRPNTLVDMHTTFKI